MRLAAVAMLIVLGACPSKGDRARVEDAIADMGRFARDMCACADKACADKIQDELGKWSSDMAQRAGARDVKPTEDQMKRMTDVVTKYGECMTAVLSPDAPRPVEKPPAIAITSKVPPATDKTDADSLVRAARDWARVARPEHQLVVLTIWYVDANGVIDNVHGKLRAAFGRTDLADDPKRRTGTPVTRPAERSDCFGLTWERKGGWTNEPTPCAEAYEVSVACSVREIWKRAIARGAPADAVATVSVKTATKVPAWGFWITDEPRNVHIAEELTDDCPLVVEK